MKAAEVYVKAIAAMMKTPEKKIGQQRWHFVKFVVAEILLSSLRSRRKSARGSYNLQTEGAG